MVSPIKKDLEYHRREAAKLREEIKVLNDKQHGLLNELYNKFKMVLWLLVKM